jgi:hypothetical protein
MGILVVLNSVLYLMAVFSPSTSPSTAIYLTSSSAKADEDEDDEEAAKVPTVDPPHSRFILFLFFMFVYFRF